MTTSGGEIEREKGMGKTDRKRQRWEEQGGSVSSKKEERNDPRRSEGW